MTSFENFVEPFGIDWVRKTENTDAFCGVVNTLLSERFNESGIVRIAISEIQDAVSADVVADWDEVLNAGIRKYETYGWRVDVTPSVLSFNLTVTG